jgi:putative oxygen-independent coproporphyrinogen III oxidase
MAGIYIHIPFCKSRCIYCNFYSTTAYSNLQHRYIDAVCKELIIRQPYLKGESIRTVYIGGGTPSLLDEESLRNIFQTLEKTYGLTNCEEITIEVNPDDITKEYLSLLKRFPINRISMGVQTFDNELLKFINRRHDAQEAIHAYHLCREAGYQNISIDLIYGLPKGTITQWENDIEQVLSLRPNHISAYSLSYEEGTPLFQMRKKHLVQEVDEQRSLDCYNLLMEKLAEAGYEHYEISNFCLPGRYSRHNSSYWERIPYLGCGAAAHSYNGNEREWNISDLHLYIIGIENGERNFQFEELSSEMQYDEYIMTALRTSKGIDLTKLKELFGNERHDYCLRMAAPHIKSGKMEIEDNHLRLSRIGIFVSDDIISDLFFIKD